MNVYFILYTILSYLITYFIGHSILACFKIENKLVYTKEFFKPVIGVIFIVLCYSIFKTKGITINLGILILVLSLLVWTVKNNLIQPIKETTERLFKEISLFNLITQLSFLLLFSVYFLYTILRFSDNTFYTINDDFYIYIKLIQSLNISGIESTQIDIHNKIQTTRGLYHFGELWYSAFYAALLNKSPFLSFYFILYPHYLIICLLGASALAEIFFNYKYAKNYLLAFLIVILCGISFYIPKTTIFTRNDWWDNGIIFQPKYLFSAIFIFTSIILIKLKKYYLFVLCSLICILLNSVQAPAVFITVSMFILFLYLNKKISFIQLVKYASLIILNLLFIGIYVYATKLSSENNNLISTINSKQLDVEFNIFKYLKTLTNCFIGQIIKSILSIIIFIPAFLLFNKRKENFLNPVFIFIVILHISSILSYAIFHFTVDAIQLWTNIYIPFSVVVVYILILKIINSHNFIKYPFLVLIIFLSIKQIKLFKRGNKIDNTFLSKIKEKYNDNNGIVFFKDKDEYTSIFSKNINLYAPASYLIMFYQNYNPICLSVFDIPLSDDKMLRTAENQIIQNSVFNRFVSTQKKNNEFKSINKSQLDFIKQKNIKHIILYSKSHLPDYILPLVQSSIYGKEEGITFYTLK